MKLKLQNGVSDNTLLRCALYIGNIVFVCTLVHSIISWQIFFVKGGRIEILDCVLHRFSEVLRCPLCSQTSRDVRGTCGTLFVLEASFFAKPGHSGHIEASFLNETGHEYRELLSKARQVSLRNKAMKEIVMAVMSVT